MTSSFRAAGVAVCLVFLVARGSAQPPKEPAKPIAEWIADLDHPTSESTREAARRALGPEGPFRQAAIPALIDALRKLHPFHESTVIVTLGDHGTAAVPKLLETLKRPEANVRSGSILALGRVRPRPADAVHAIVAAMKDEKAEVRSNAAVVLSRMRGAAGQAIPALVTGLGDSEPGVRANSAEALGQLVRKPGPAVVALARAVTDADEGVRYEASMALVLIGPAAGEVAPMLFAALGQSRPIPPAAWLGWAPSVGRTVVAVVAVAAPVAIDAITDGSPSSPRTALARALSRLGPAAKGGVPLLIAALRDPERRVRAEAAAALGSIGPDASAAVPDLLAAAMCKQNLARWHAISALGQIGPAAKSAVPYLVEELGAKYIEDRFGAMDALGGIGLAAKEAVPALTKIARNRQEDSQMREYAAKAVAHIDPAFAANEGLEFAHLNIRLGRVPVVPLKPRPITPEQTKRAKSLIAKLAQVDKPDYGLSPTLNGQAFAPLPGRGKMSSGLITDHQLATADAFRELVAMGPAAIPSLLDALADRTPTKLKIKAGPFGGLFFGDGIPRNPFNAAEKRALAVKPLEEDGDDDPIAGGHTVTVGDVCFVAVGQIVGRPYQAVRYIPTAMISVHSPTESKALRDRVRAAWAGDDPAKLLLDSLLTDFATEGIFNGRSLDGWYEGSDYQIAAAVRLLYYFPDEAAPLIAARLRALDVMGGPEKPDWIQREAKNAVRTCDFVRAVAWCRAAPIRDALAEIAKKTDDLTVKAAITEGGK
ncbi:MAG TPA: HEAT repeat domain-containing protein [Gemmataceae bacterium]|nr:HEAT repeat domain-containing protein [Gemmataceae bacterium]